MRRKDELKFELEKLRKLCREEAEKINPDNEKYESLFSRIINIRMELEKFSS